MLLAITNRTPTASDLGFLVHKNPSRTQTFDVGFGKAHVTYPEATEAICTAALVLDVDPISLVRGRGRPGEGGFTLDQYVNDRPYVASSFLSVAIAEVFGTALQGRCAKRPELAEAQLDLSARLAALPCRGGESFLRGLFEPLGYEVRAERLPLDERFPDWGDSRMWTVEIRQAIRLCDLLGHVYVLVPVLDDAKHYFVANDEVDKLLRHGEGWLRDHPMRDEIARRYLRHQRSLAGLALARLVGPAPEGTESDAAEVEDEGPTEEKVSLNEQRIGSVVAAIKACSARSVLDLGCGEGRLLRELMRDREIERIVGVDVSIDALEKARDRLRLDRLPEVRRRRIELLHGSVLYRDRRLDGFDAAALVEVIEHLDPPRLAALERVVFEFARPGRVVVTTPNVEFNVEYERLAAGTLRHRDHRFEWTREEFQAWARDVAGRFGYEVRFLPVGEERPGVGSPTQMGVFDR